MFEGPTFRSIMAKIQRALRNGTGCHLSYDELVILLNSPVWPAVVAAETEELRQLHPMKRGGRDGRARLEQPSNGEGGRSDTPDIRAHPQEPARSRIDAVHPPLAKDDPVSTRGHRGIHKQSSGARGAATDPNPSETSSSGRDKAHSPVLAEREKSEIVADDRPFSVSKLAARWACSEGAIRKKIERGELAAFRLGKLIRIRAEEVERVEGEFKTGKAHGDARG